VTLNQLALAPVTLCAVFAWNLGWTGQWHAVPDKIQNDLVPSMINGEPNINQLALVTHIFMIDRKWMTLAAGFVLDRVLYT
jgi:hypothetical protein